MPIYPFKQVLLNLPRPVKRVMVVFFDLFICVFSVWLALGLRLDQWGQPHGKQWIFFLSTIGISCPLFIFFGLYQAIFRFVGTVAFLSIVRVFLIYTGLIFFIFTVIGVGDVPRSIGIIQPILLFICIGASRYFMRHWLGSISNIKQPLHRAHSVAMIYGAGSAGRQLAAVLSANKEILVKGFFDDDSHLQGSTVDEIPVYPNTDVHNLIRRLGITEILLAIPSASQIRRNEIISSLNGCGVRVRTLPSLIDMFYGRVRVSDLHDLDMNDLLGRMVIDPDVVLLEKNIHNKVVLVTGAGGSIGSELCRQIIKFSPRSMILIDMSEHALYQIHEELLRFISMQVISNKGGAACEDSQSTPIKIASIKLIPCMMSVRDAGLMLRIFSKFRPDTVFHAAAYKHVPLVEKNLIEGIRNNVFGTLTCAQTSLECGVSNFILVSTDKAVRPTNVMGASKRIAELVLQAMANLKVKGDHSTNFSMVRFGNVLGSSGSVAPLFSAQIAAGGPITLTHPEMTRYFMTIPEAAQLVIQASSMATGGDVFVLDMGEPVRIYDLASKMIYLSGLLVKDEAHPHGDIEIKVTGLLPGEKLYEELLIGDDPQPTAHPKIMKAHEDFLSWENLQRELEKLILVFDTCDDKLIRSMIKKIVPGYQPNEVVGEDCPPNAGSNDTLLHQGH